MPFIKKENRMKFNKVVQAMVDADVKADGDLNYILYKFCKYNVPESYNSYKNFLGELRECENQCRNDFLVPYEVIKRKENGDV